MENALRIHPADTVAVALKPLAQGEKALGVTLLSDIPAGHKFALAPVAAGENIIKYGFPPGYLRVDGLISSTFSFSSIFFRLVV